MVHVLGAIGVCILMVVVFPVMVDHVMMVILIGVDDVLDVIDAVLTICFPLCVLCVYSLLS